ncbi:MAG: fused MFS/spermidine synthase [Syntrophales bacterium]|nr:fused MFS/spermidine synthase [Syntrophales bacterium]MDD5641435.1 fused MFS/spermidine synthase [Syntrophales bacterium]
MRNHQPNNGATGPGLAMPVLVGMVFLGATLLFGMEPLVGRILVPFFGGAAHVWLTSLMFFQAMLLVGYLYAHLCAQRLGPWHLLLLVLPLVNLPLAAVAQPAPETPLFTLLAVLVVNFALPFAVLATTAVVAQSWLARSAAGQRHNPYPLYAASNAGSLLALFGYAFLAEPLLGVRAQSLVWTGGYLVYAALVVASWFILRPGRGPGEAKPQTGAAGPTEPAPTASQYARWLLLSALPSGLLLTVTNFIALEVGSFPMVWVFPLALYLGSFVVIFRNNGGTPTLLGALWPEVVILGFLLYLLPMAWVGWFAAVIAPLLVLLSLCLVAHGELYERRPPVRYLTNYYLTMAVGGFLGGALVSLAAPRIFSGLYEFPVILAALAVTFWWCRLPAFGSSLKWPSRIRRVRRVATSLLLGFTGLCLIGQIQQMQSSCKFRHRNFYGIYRVMDRPPSTANPAGLRLLVHGKTNHGAQFLAPEQRRRPTSYYYRNGAIAAVYKTVPSPRRLAVIGLGAGVVSAYTRPQDVLTYFEIDPDNERIARSWFTYLEDSQAPVAVVPGDGRLSMNQAAPGKDFDIIHVDAFTGDGIPTHLLTRQAMEVYLSRLSPDGVILFHISNRYYDLRAVLKATAARLNLAGVMNIPDQRRIHAYEISPQCVVFARTPARLQPLVESNWVALGKNDGLKGSAGWTDDYINILAPLWANLRPAGARSSTVGPPAAGAEVVR